MRLRAACAGRRIARRASLLLVLVSPWLSGCEQRTLGEQVWRDECASCHGLDGAGNTVRFMSDPQADLLDNNWKYGGDEASIRDVVREGVFGKMPANDSLDEEELAAVVDWLYQLRGERQ